MRLSEIVKQIEDYISKNGDVEVWVKPTIVVGRREPKFRIDGDGFGHKIIHLYYVPIY